MSTAGTAGGTRFLLYCQPRFLEEFKRPVVHELKVPAGSVKAGPMDDRIKVVNAVDKTLYDDNSFPPYRGEKGVMAEPDEDGHFDRLEPGTPQFNAAHAYAAGSPSGWLTPGLVLDTPSSWADPSNGADLIVVGSHGRHGLALLLGSTANGVLHGATCDVLAVRVGSIAEKSTDSDS